MITIKIGLRIGHSPNCRGAKCFVDEYDENKKIFNELMPLLQKNGHTVIVCNSNANTESKELKEGTDKCTHNACDLYVTLHMNAYKKTNNPMGCEVVVFSKTDLDTRIVNELSKLGFKNRGVKINQGLHDTRATVCHSVIVETCFVDSKADTELYYKELGAKRVAQAIAKGICGSSYKDPVVTKPNGVKYTVQCGAFSKYENAKDLEKQLKAKGFDCFVKEV